MATGTVLWFNDISAEGRIKADEDGASIKVSHKAILRQGYKILDEGQRVSFDIVRRPSGLEAQSVVLLE